MSVVKVLCFLLISTRRVQPLSSFDRAEVDFIGGEDERISTALDLNPDLNRVQKEITKEVKIFNQEIHPTTKPKNISKLNPHPNSMPLTKIITKTFQNTTEEGKMITSDPNPDVNPNPTSNPATKYKRQTKKIPYIAVAIVIFAIFILSFCFVAAALIWHVRTIPFT